MPKTTSPNTTRCSARKGRSRPFAITGLSKMNIVYGKYIQKVVRPSFAYNKYSVIHNILAFLFSACYLPFLDTYFIGNGFYFKESFIADGKSGTMVLIH